MELTVVQNLARNAREGPTEVALVDGRDAWTWSELHAAASAVARRIASELPAGACVMICAGNEPGFVAAYLGTLMAGNKVFPITPDSTAMELSAAANDSGSKAIIGIPTALAALHGLMGIPIAQVPEMRCERASLHSELRDGEQCAMLLTSSGTTGRPKIVHRNAGALNGVVRSVGESVGFRSTDRILAAVPLCHSYGVEHGLLAAISYGSRVHLMRGFDLPLVMQTLQQGITLFPGVPSMFEALARIGNRVELPMLRQAYSAGAPLPRSVADGFEERFGKPIGQVFGTSETGSATFSDANSPDFDPNTVGKAMPGVEIRIGAGQIAVRSEGMFDRYISGTSELSSDGFFQTGDLGALDDRGNLSITGRLKLLIDIGGQKVNPQEVELVIADHPAVSACVVLPMNLSPTVTRTRALVVLRAGMMATTNDLRAFVRPRLSSYKIPRVFEFRESLPRSTAGKILRHKVQA